MIRIKVCTLASAVLLTSAVVLHAQAGGQEFKGQVQVKIGTHQVKVEDKKLYEIVLDGPKDHNLNMSVQNPGVFWARDKNFRVECGFFVANRTGDVNITVMPPVGMANLTMDYALKVKSYSLAGKPLLDETGQWTDKDPTYKPTRDSYYKDFKVKFEANKVYVIDLMNAGSKGDPYLYLEGPDGKVLLQDDDSGGFPNARIVYAPAQAAEFRIIATTLSKAVGDFKLTVRQAE